MGGMWARGFRTCMEQSEVSANFQSLAPSLEDISQVDVVPQFPIWAAKRLWNRKASLPELQRVRKSPKVSVVPRLMPPGSPLHLFGSQPALGTSLWPAVRVL